LGASKDELRAHAPPGVRAEKEEREMERAAREPTAGRPKIHSSQA